MELRTVLSLLFNCLCLEATLAAVAYQRLQAHPDHPDQCYLPDTGAVRNVSSSWPMGDGVCGQISCHREGEDIFYLEWASCGLALVAPPCRLVSRPELPYPHCCPQMECPEPEGIFDDSEEQAEMYLPEEPVETDGEPVENKEEPVETEEIPVETAEEPVDTKEKPVETVEEPVEILEPVEPSLDVQQPVELDLEELFLHNDEEDNLIGDEAWPQQPITMEYDVNMGEDETGEETFLDDDWWSQRFGRFL